MIKTCLKKANIFAFNDRVLKAADRLIAYAIIRTILISCKLSLEKGKNIC